MTEVSSVKQRSIPGGKIFFDPYDEATGLYAGEEYIGLTPGFTVSVASTKKQTFSAEDGLFELDEEALTQVLRTGKLTCRQISLRNLSRFLIGSVDALVQASGSVTDEALSVLLDRYYQLGKSVANPSGVRSVSAVTVTAGDAAVAWAATAAKAVGALVKQTASATHFFRCKVAGTTGGTEPTWVTTPGAQTTDATVTWECMGILSPVADTDYTLDADLARIYVLPAARVHPTLATPWLVDYTKATKTRDRIQSSALAEVVGALRFIAAPMKGSARDLYGPKVTLSPSGDGTFKNPDPDFVELAWDLSFAKGPNGEPALIIDGRPY